jgi:glycosyltransferase involved in cell wall biosynthesis
VIIPTRDSAADLGRCLASLEGQGVSLEAIVVDQESRDGTREAAAARGARVVELARPSLYAPPTRSRNAGASDAQGEFLVHLDADMSLAPAALASALRICREGGHVAVTLEEIDVTDGFWSECKAFERQTYRGSTVLEAARFVRTTVFRAVGGYDEELGSGEDWDIHTRYAKQGSIGRLEGAVYHHLGSVSLTSSSAGFRRKHGTADVSRAVFSSYMRSWRVLARDPVHALGFAFLRAGEASALASGLLLESIERRGSSGRRGR